MPIKNGKMPRFSRKKANLSGIYLAGLNLLVLSSFAIIAVKLTKSGFRKLLGKAGRYNERYQINKGR